MLGERSIFVISQDRVLILATAPWPICRARWPVVERWAAGRPMEILAPESHASRLQTLPGVDRIWIYPAVRRADPSLLSLREVAPLRRTRFAAVAFVVGTGDLADYALVDRLARRFSRRVVAVTDKTVIEIRRGTLGGLRLRRVALRVWRRGETLAMHLRGMAENRLSSLPHPLPFVTVVTTTYQRDEMLRQAIESTVAQTYDRWEHIVVDTGSTDSTEEVVRSFQDPRVRLVQFGRTNEGAPPRNFGARAGTGELLAFLDSDDLWLPGRLQRMVARWIEAGRPGIVYANMADWDGRPRPWWRGWAPEPALFSLRNMRRRQGRVLPELLSGNFIGSGAVLVERGLFESVGGYPTSLDVLAAEDYALWLRCASVAEFASVPEVLFLYRVHEGQFSRKRDFFLLRAACLRDWLGWLNGPARPPLLPGLDGEMLRRMGEERMAELESFSPR